MERSLELPLVLQLDEMTMEALENLAATQQCSLAECVQLLVKKACRPRETKRGSSNVSKADAPLDAFLPEGCDPFAPAQEGLASHFADIQARMRFAGTSSLLRDYEDKL